MLLNLAIDIFVTDLSSKFFGGMMKFLIIVLSLILSLSSFAKWSAEKEFKTNCATCHSIGYGDVDAKGKKLQGPDLASVSKRRKMDWIIKFVKYPTGMIEGDEEEEGYEKADPIAKKVYAAYKPAMMSEQELEDDQIKAIIKYIDSKKKTSKGKITKIK